MGIMQYDSNTNIFNLQIIKMHLQRVTKKWKKVKFQPQSTYLNAKQTVLANFLIIVLIQVRLHLCENNMQLVKGFCK